MQAKSIAKIILSILAVGVGGLVAVAAPNAVGMLTPLVRKQRGTVNRRSLERAFKRLREERLVEFSVRNGKTVLQVSERGKKRWKEMEFEDLRLTIPKRWDGVWTVILFDIPEHKKTARDALRLKLRQLGCFPYHKSVFVHPADCRDEVDFIAELFEINRYVIHFRTPSLGNQEYRARKYFGLIT